MKDLEATHG